MAQNTCEFWNCDTPIRTNHFLCYDHFLDLEDGEIDECPRCERFKDAQYAQCLECQRGSLRDAPGSGGGFSRYEPEYSPAWRRGDEDADEFFVYILKLDGGEFYPGQTRDLRARLSEHRDGRVQSTAGRNPKLQWFISVFTRDEATTIESELKRLNDKNPRKIRKFIIEFQDLVEELDFSPAG